MKWTPFVRQYGILFPYLAHYPPTWYTFIEGSGQHETGSHDAGMPVSLTQISPQSRCVWRTRWIANILKPLPKPWPVRYCAVSPMLLIYREFQFGSPRYWNACVPFQSTVLTILVLFYPDSTYSTEPLRKAAGDWFCQTWHWAISGYPPRLLPKAVPYLLKERVMTVLLAQKKMLFWPRIWAMPV